MSTGASAREGHLSFRYKCSVMEMLELKRQRGSGMAQGACHAGLPASSQCSFHIMDLPAFLTWV